MVNVIRLLDTFYRNALGLLDTYLATIVLALVILLIGFILARLIDRIIYRILDEIEINTITKRATQLKVDVKWIISKVAATIAYAITVFLAADQLKLTVEIIVLIVIIIGGFSIISLLLAAKDFIPNVLAGLKIIREKKVKPRDKIAISSVKGVVKEVTLSETKVVNKHKDIIHIPNATLLKELKD